MTQTYEQFLESKRIVTESCGFEVPASAINPILYDFQNDVTRWALKRGRSALFLDCGLGKSFCQIEWARLVQEKYGEPVLIAAPLAVARQTIGEAAKLGIELKYVTKPDNGIPLQITNYERLVAFTGFPYAGIVLDESSILKSIDGATRELLLTEFTGITYRLCCTATPCPNDIAELANHAEFLGAMKRSEMLASFFVHDQDGWRMRGHAAKAFYRWLASWSMALKSPSDLGYDGSRFALPPLEIIDSIVSTDWRKPGHLFAGGLHGITDRASVRKQSVPDRVQRCVEIVERTEGPVIVWCGLNDEAAMVAKAIGAVNVSGADDPETKADLLGKFQRGEIARIVTKGKIWGYGTNLQVCPTLILLGLSDSYELYYQIIRRHWRYGQKQAVKAYVIVTDHETEIVDNVRRKELEAETLSREIIAAAREYEMEELGKAKPLGEIMDRETFEGEGYRVHQGDCVETMRQLPDNSIDLSVYSPPFLSLYQYSASEADMGNSKDPEIFFRHFTFMMSELLRMTRPGRLTCVHVWQVATTLTTHGVIGLQDFRGRTISAYQEAGWVYHGEVCIDKDPQAQAIRTHAKGLLFVQLKKDSSWLRPAMADYILVFRKTGENAVPIHPDINNEEWIEWARPIWYGIRESNTLNTAEAKSDEDDRHICPLQLGTIERCIRLWSNVGDTVFSPFAGIGSEGYESLRLGRKFIGCELKPLYARTAVRNLKRALEIAKQSKSTLFDAVEA